LVVQYRTANEGKSMSQTAANSSPAPSRQSVVTWFEIPASNFERAVTFYEQLFGVSLIREKMGPSEMAVFPYDKGHAISGCVMSAPGYLPNKDGAVVYLNSDQGIDTVLARVASAGGSIAFPKTALPPGMGFFAHIVDTEGNRVGVHGLK
jgi:predicted enzyme related to lactoylglutathione lyase